ncbi:GH36-type glycosyl hydrolase domain-containing protein [Serratia oryzae]|uniref:Cyclic beta 1-2 glucan synthetase n=1 Tax=Serratia oryzae TaxID=2034155 RepID=A0A1S8CJC9_9GAMM|nr:cyclic beta 1-2 glucan synthetase [Serratia oryzae]
MKINFNRWFSRKPKLPLAAKERQPATDKRRDEATINAELFSIDQMERYGQKLARSHKLASKKTPYFLLKRLDDNEAVLTHSCHLLSTGGKVSIAPAGEWLLDNFYLVEEQIRLVRHHLPKNFGKGLPQLSAPHNCPRIYDIATEAIAHGDGRWDTASLTRYIAAYQKVSVLTLGELWALPGMLRLALIENLRRVSIEVAETQQERNLATRWVNKMLDSAENDPANLIVVIAEMASSNPPRASAFVAELVRCLKGHGKMLALPLTWVEQRLAEVGLTSDQIILRFNQQLANSQLSVSNSISSLRQLSDMNWAEFAETMSLVEHTLNQDPAQIYGKMHFDTRDHYRHIIEALARQCARSEGEVAKQVLTLAQSAADQGCMRHVGYYLVDKGRDDLEQCLAIRRPPLLRLRDALKQASLSSWLGGLGLVTAVGSLYILSESYRSDAPLLLWLLAIPTAIVVSQFAINLLSEVINRLKTPKPLPRMDFSCEIPPRFRSLIVMPSMLMNRAGIDELINSLEVCYLGNAMPHLHFALLTDFPDAPTQTMPEDADLLTYAVYQIAQLNRRYPAHLGTSFFLLHRERAWNPKQGVWMGYERKRGKLAALNQWLRHQQQQFATVAGNHPEVLSNVKYVITLDADTVLPREAAHQLVATMAHPLNYPVYDPQSKRVVSGYSILQPRLAEEIPRYGQSRYAAMSSSVAGNDPYSLMSSDLYQDLFKEGSFVGKGIYDVDMFICTTSGVCPENLVLSHDLLEGCYARSGLLSDVLLYEQYPANYLVDVARRTRWIRGDWQLLNWLRLRVRQADNSRIANPLSVLSRWKLVDNLRRSLVAPSLLMLLFYSLTIAPNPLFCLLALAIMLLLPTLLMLLQGLISKPRRRPLLLHVSIVLNGTLKRLSHIGLHLATLPHESCYSVRAIAVTLWRLAVSQRNLHEWTSFAQSQSGFAPQPSNFYRAMWLNPVAGIVLALLSARLNPALLPFALALGLLWFIAPRLLSWLSQQPVRSPVAIHDRQRRFLRQTSREIWSFFETFANQRENWLPPDNYQEIPLPAIAHRTSPTNIGLSLLANLTAWDFGYIPQGEALQRISLTLDTLDKMEHYRGHLYNWYDTRTLAPLSPRYISSVDSGNLAGHLLTLSSGLNRLKNQPILEAPRLIAGLNDALYIIEERWGEAAPSLLRQVRSSLNDLTSLPLNTLFAPLSLTMTLASGLQNLAGSKDGVLTDWLEKFDKQLSLMCAEWTLLLGWITPDTELTTLPSTLWLAQADRPSSAIGPQQLASMQPAIEQARQRLAIMAELEKRLNEHAIMDFQFLYHQASRQLSVGYNCDITKMDSGKYDLLPSEIRLTNFFAIAANQLPMKSWFALGRLFTLIDKQPALMSWSGSMFEYLMPQLVMPAYPDTLLTRMCQSAVERQIEWGKQCGVPWGISESGYFSFDPQQNYQYHAFGVPGLGLRRGLGDDVVIAPYATLMALMIAPQQAYANLRLLEKNGAKGQFGFYEALDYTASRLARGQVYAIVQSYMAHHQGMGFLALSHLLLEAPMVDRFAANPSFQSARLLLQERVPDAVELYSPRRQFESYEGRLKSVDYQTREFNDVSSPIPEVQLLSNTHYHLMVTQAGGGYSRWKDIALTRWREDTTRDNRGTFCYLSDPKTGEMWSTTWQPVGQTAEHYHVLLTDAGAEFNRTEGTLSVQTKIVVSPEDDVELRRMTLIHRGRHARTIEITTYAEVVLAPAANELAHPAFNNLFIQTELLPKHEAILCHRRPREPHEHCPWLLHMMVIHGDIQRETSFETDRAKFIGRGQTPGNPQALKQGGALSNTCGPVLDPVIAIRQRIRLEPGVPVIIDAIYGVSPDRPTTLALIEKYRDSHLADRVFAMVRSHSQVVLRQLNASEDDASLFNRLAAAVLFPSHELRAESRLIMQNRRGQSGLWGHAISGDLPIVLLTVTDDQNMGIVTTLIRAHNYWRLKGLRADLVILNDSMGGYRQDLHNQIVDLIAEDAQTNQRDKSGGIFIRNGEQVSSEDRTLLLSVAHIVLDDQSGGLLEQITQRMQPTLSIQQPLIPKVNLPRNLQPQRRFATEHLAFFNGFGGFSSDGREYQILLEEGKNTPAPWSNVIANASFGTVLSESGQAYTWYENAHEYRLTPWENDPVCDSSGEAFYLRDEESGYLWSPMALPLRGQGRYLTRHGFGYSVFEHQETGIDSELTVMVAEHAAVKLFTLTLSNNSGRTRKLLVTGYVEWVLGNLRSTSARHVVTSAASVANGCGVLANNYYGSNGSERTAFFAVSGAHCAISGDRGEFLGRNGSPAAPAALQLLRLSNKTGAGFDPCGAVQSATTLIDGDQRTFVFALGIGQDAQEAEALIRQFLSEDAANAELGRIHHHWHQMLDKIQVTTPDAALNLLTNGWLMYQTLACRILARSGYYQSGGAYGFRDQLQDSLALAHAAPERMREQILLCASRQFVEGDVQHWWHPPQGNGVRTRCSDDYLWLPLAICHYVKVTGDSAILDQKVGYLEARRLNPGEESSYEHPSLSSVEETLWQHGVRAIRHGLTFGEHGLPLIGCGDWNDGMNLVGLEGRGESVWLGFFFYSVLQSYATLAQQQRDGETEALCREQAATLKQNLHDHGWDGEWYRRGYFDGGEPLGSHTANECQIDAIAQSWSILSGAGDSERSQQAMQQLDRQLVDAEAGIIKLLMPPFDGNGPNPGYIRGYLPGVRENGGQYTHGAIWAVMAFAEMGEVERAWLLMAMINPINHSLNGDEAERYKAEPYVMCADIYAVDPHAGRGGWSWYTGSAGWTYRLITESLLGLERHGECITLHTRLPASWPEVSLSYQQGSSRYQITVRRSESQYRVVMDGNVLADDRIPIGDDGVDHRVEVFV